MTQVHDPTPLHFKSAYASLEHKEGDFPVTIGAAEILFGALPMYPQLEHYQQKQIVQGGQITCPEKPVGSRESNYRVSVSEGCADMRRFLFVRNLKT